MKKDEGSHCFDDSILSSVNAPSLIANDFIKKEISNFNLYLYTYNQIYEEKEGIFYKITDDDVYFYNGLVSLKDSNQIPDIKDIFDAIDNNQLILGDFQAVHLDSENNAFFKTSDSSIYPMFCFENEDCFVLSNEMKLIVDGINCFRTNFVNNFDYGYMEEIFFKGFFKKKDGNFRRTIFKNIIRILPHDDIAIKNGSIHINQNSDIAVPKWFEDWYLEDKDSLYNWYYASLLEYSESLIKRISNNVNEITAGITGGFDSRLTVALLSKICGKYGIKITTDTEGLPEHPDVIIGGKVANKLSLDWSNPQQTGENHLKRTPQTFQEYAATFYESQGDFDSNNFVTFYKRNINNVSSFHQTGMDVYKRDSMSSIINFNRWYSRRVLFKSNFYFPLFSSNFELWFSRLYDKHYKDQKQYTEFVYNVLKRLNPALLEIPFAFESLPQVEVEPLNYNGYVNTQHKSQPFLWDYNFVYNELNPVLQPKFDEIDGEYDSILSKSGINSLDYFLLKDKITGILNNSKNINVKKKKLKALKDKSFYSKNRVYVDLEKAKMIGRERSLMKLMDWASAASFDSFYSLEKYANFNGENPFYDSKEKIYEDYENLNKESEDLSKESKKLKKQVKDLKKVNNSILNSNSWKLTKPLRVVVRKFKK